MKLYFFKIFIVIFIVIGSFFISQLALAINPPVVSFTDGDDINQDGGFYDPYDSLIVFEIYTNQPADFLNYVLQYSNDGQGWQDIVADYVVIDTRFHKRRYYWSTSGIYAPTLWFKAYSVHTSGNSEEYLTDDLSLYHRISNPTNNFFVEQFIDDDYKDALYTNANWDTSPGRWLVELPPGGRGYQNQAFAGSINLLPTDGSVATLTSVSLQPVHAQDYVGQPVTIGYKISIDGINWYPSGGGNWHNFDTSEIVPEAWEQDFTSSFGRQLFWRARLFTNNTDITPRIYQLRFIWEENHTPQACFTVNPTSNLEDPQQEFVFNGSCSADYEDLYTQLYYRWDFDNDGNWDTGNPRFNNWLLGGYSVSNVYNSTSSFVINLEIKDSLDAVDSYTSSINEESLAGDIYGWMWGATGYGGGLYERVGAGWTSLNCDNIYYLTPINLCEGTNRVSYGLEMDDQNIWGWAWNQYWGWLCFGSTCADPIWNWGLAPDGTESWATYSRSTGEVQGWGKFVAAAGWGEDPKGWLKLRDENWCGDSLVGQGQYSTDCTYFDLSDRTLEGFAWSGWEEEQYPGEQVGPGWQSFTHAYLNLPWLETLYGSMYTGSILPGGVNTAPPPGRYSASYCILSSDTIVNFTSGIDCTEEYYNTLEFPQEQNQYRTILGVIDFNKILTGAENISSDDIDGELPVVLNNQVYHFVDFSDYTIDQPITFFNAQTIDSSGAGTVVIEGNLRINSNVYYEGAAVSSQIENLASVAWIVKGDVIIDPAVTHLVGTFIVVGDGSALQNPGYGSFKTGDDSADNKQLVVKGLVTARGLEFQRYYRIGGEPAEQIIYDGRALVNTPPGLEDFAKALPKWQETFATTQIE